MPTTTVGRMRIGALLLGLGLVFMCLVAGAIVIVSKPKTEPPGQIASGDQRVPLDSTSGTSATALAVHEQTPPSSATSSWMPSAGEEAEIMAKAERMRAVYEAMAKRSAQVPEIPSPLPATSAPSSIHIVADATILANGDSASAPMVVTEPPAEDHEPAITVTTDPVAQVSASPSSHMVVPDVVLDSAPVEIPRIIVSGIIVPVDIPSAPATTSEPITIITWDPVSTSASAPLTPTSLYAAMAAMHRDPDAAMQMAIRVRVEAMIQNDIMALAEADEAIAMIHVMQDRHVQQALREPIKRVMPKSSIRRDPIVVHEPTWISGPAMHTP
jgi:hypothetical protein